VIGVNETGRPQMATISKRRNGDGSTSWDAMVRIVGYPATGRSFRTKLAAELWAAHTEAARKGARRALSTTTGVAVGAAGVLSIASLSVDRREERLPRNCR